MEIEQISENIKFLTSKFAEYYSYYPESEKDGIEYNGYYSLEDELKKGYCLHFANLLKMIYQQGQIKLAKNYNHYIFLYQDHYFDYRGCIGDKNVIEILPNIFITEQDLYPEEIEASKEFKRAFLIYDDDNQIWKEIEPKLLKLSQQNILKKTR